MCYTGRTSTCGESRGIQCMTANVFDGSGDLAISNISLEHSLFDKVDSLRHDVRFTFVFRSSFQRL